MEVFAPRRHLLDALLSFTSRQIRESTSTEATMSRSRKDHWSSHLLLKSEGSVKLRDGLLNCINTWIATAEKGRLIFVFDIVYPPFKSALHRLAASQSCL